MVKEYSSFCHLVFEGEYLDGKRWKGKEYDPLDKLGKREDLNDKK